MPRVTLLVRVRTHGEVDPVGKPGTRRPDLVPVDDETMPVSHGTRRERCQVAPGLGLREALAERELPARDRPEEPLLQREAWRTARARSRSSCTRGGRARAGASGNRRRPRRALRRRASSRDPRPRRATSSRSTPLLPAHASPRASRRRRASPGGATPGRRRGSGAGFRRTPRLRPGARAAPLSVGGPRANDRRAP